VATVYNWQIGRDMEYQYAGARPDKQFAMVFDTNKCIACQTCTIACKNAWTSGRGQEYMFWNNVETKPYGNYPMGWDSKLLELLGPQTWSSGVYTGKTIFEAAPSGERSLGIHPDDDDYRSPNIGEDEVFGIVERGLKVLTPHIPWMYYLPRICNHCTYPSCLASCPRGSIYKRKEDGIVLIDQGRCRGYQECVRGCPFKKSFFRPTSGISEKCIGCFPKVEQGLQPFCVQNCIGKIRLMGFLNLPENADPTNPLDFLVHEKKLALPLYPQFGLEGNIYYIPPVHVPPAFLRQMFGPGAESAINAYRAAVNDPEVIGLIQLFGSTDRIVTRFEMQGDEAVGFDRDGVVVARAPLEEPFHVRPEYDTALAVPRKTIT
jgi:nitrate reductase beta subunit